MENWWNLPLRAVTLEFPASDVATIDVEGIVNETHHGAVNTLCVFCIGYYPGGTAFYQSRLAPHYPGLGERDLLTETLNAAHHNGQKVIAYIASIWGGREMFLAHEDWAQRKADGQVTSWDEDFTSVAMCPNSPYREYLAEVVREISENYAVDGFYFDEPSFQSWCSCIHCREKFYAEYHAELPVVEDWDNPTFQKFIHWRYQQITEWRRSLYELVKRDDRCIFFQGAFPLAQFTSEPFRISGLTLPNPYRDRFAVDWYVPLAHAAYLPESAAIGDVVHFELYRVSMREPLWWYGVSLRYGQTIGSGKQMLTLNMMAQTPFDQYGLPEKEIQLSMAEILANSGSPHYARYYPDRVDQKAWDHVYANFRKAKELEPYLSPRQSLKYAAILFSQSTVDRFDQVNDKPAHLTSLKGFSKALLQEKISFDILTEDELDHLNQYKVLILPNASCLSNQTKKSIRDYVTNGGGLVASYESGMYDENGNRTPQNDFSKLFGVAYSSEPPYFQGFDVYMRLEDTRGLLGNLPAGKLIPTGGIQIGVTPVSSQVVANALGGAAVHYGPLGEETNLPTVLIKHSGQLGRTVYFALPLGNRFLEFGVEAYREMIASTSIWAARGDPPVQIKNAPKTMALTGFSQLDGDRLIFHLVKSIRDETIRPIIEVPLSRDIQLMINSPRTPNRVLSLWEKQTLTWRIDNGMLLIDIPTVQENEVIMVQYP